MTGYYILIFLLLLLAIISVAYVRNPIAAAQAKKRKIRRQDLIGKKQNRLQRLYYRIDYLLQIAKMTWPIYILITFIFVAIFGSIGFLIFKTGLLVAACSVMALPVSYIFLHLRTFTFTRLQNEQLEHSMTVITNAYRSNNDIIKAINDNIDHILPREPFEEFLLEVGIIDPNINRALRRLEKKINNSYFSQWIDMLILAQTDRHMIFLLPVIVEDMNDAKSKQNAAIADMVSLWRDYFLGLLLCLAAPVMIRFLNYEWYMILIGTPVGVLLVVALLACILYSFRQVVKISKPID